MKILIVDDGDAKVGSLIKLFESKGIPSSSVDIVTDISSAKMAARKHQYAIAIVDMCMSQLPGGKIDSKAGIDFIEYLKAPRSGAHLPWKIIPYTARPKECEDEVKLLLGDGVKTYVVESPESLAEIEGAIERFLTLDLIRALRPTSHRLDTLIISALQIEYDELSAVISLSKKVNLNTVKEFRFGDFNSINGIQKSIGIACIGSMGSVTSGVAAAEILTEFPALNVILVGICGGVKKHVQIGDIVCATEVIDFQSGKLTSGGLETDVRTVQCDGNLIKGGEEIETIIRDVNLRWSGRRPELKGDHPRFRVGQVGCSSWVLDDAEYLNELKQKYRQMIGIEMESFGTGVGVLASPTPCNHFVIKSVCDYADGSKSSESQQYCAFMAANFVFEMLSRDLL